MIARMNMLTKGINTVAWATWPCPDPEPPQEEAASCSQAVQILESVFFVRV